MNKQPILSLCIPTYNRASHLDELLARIKLQYKIPLHGELIELLVSDNCSNDSTAIVVSKHIEGGLPIKYVRNSDNLGMDGNFVQCFRMARGKYIWLLGDDDYLKEGAFDKLLSILNSDDNYGLIHLQIGGNEQKEATVHHNTQKFISEVSYWITFISSNIVCSKFVKTIDFEKYMGTYFTLMPLYLTATFHTQSNMIIHKRLFEDGADSQRNGEYNFFEVFVNNYHSILWEFVLSGKINKWTYQVIKYKTFRNLILPYAYALLYKKKKGNFRTENAWGILLNRYFYCPYFYLGIIFAYIKKIIDKR